MRSKGLFLLISLLNVTQGAKWFTCNVTNDFEPIKKNTPYGSCVMEDREGDADGIMLEEVMDSKNISSFDYLGETIYTVVPSKTSSLFTHDLIDQIHPTRHTSHATTQYIQWKDAPMTHFCSPIHCLSFPSASHFYLVHSDSHSFNACKSSDNILPIEIGASKVLNKEVCISTKSSYDSTEHVVFNAPRNSAFYITLHPIGEITIITHRKGKLPTEEPIITSTPTPLSSDFPFFVTPLNDHFRLNKDHLSSSSSPASLTGSGFAITGRFFPLQVLNSKWIVRTPTRVYYLEEGAFNVKVVEDKPHLLPCPKSSNPNCFMERLIIQDFDNTTYPSGPTTLPHQGKFSAKYHHEHGYELRDKRTVTGAPALKRYLEMEKELSIKFPNGELPKVRLFLEKKEKEYYIGGETYLYSPIAAWLNEGQNDIAAQAQGRLVRLGRRGWAHEGLNRQLAKEMQKVMDNLGEKPEWWRHWMKADPCDENGWYKGFALWINSISMYIIPVCFFFCMYVCCCRKREVLYEYNGKLYNDPPVPAPQS